MNLIFFLTSATLVSIILGEFGQYPFGITSISVSLTDILLFITLVFLIIWQVAIQKKMVATKHFLLIILFYFISMLSLVFSGRLQGGLYLIRYIFYSLSFFLGYVLTRSHINLILVLKVICFATFGIALLGYIQLLFFPDLYPLSQYGYDPHKNRLFSTLLDPNYAGTILNIGFIITLYFYIAKSKNKVWLLLSILFGIAILLTFSRSAYLSLITGMLVLGLGKFRKLLIIFTGIFLILYFFVTPFHDRVMGAINIDKTSKERVVSWQRGLSIFEKHPLLGIGFNNIRYFLERYNLITTFSYDGGNSGAGIDSSLIFVLATTGILGFISYVSWWISVLITSIKSQSSFKLFLISILLGLLINSIFINSLFFPPVMLLYFILTGAFIGENFIKR